MAYELFETAEDEEEHELRMRFGLSADQRVEGQAPKGTYQKSKEKFLRTTSGSTSGFSVALLCFFLLAFCCFFFVVLLFLPLLLWCC